MELQKDSVSQQEIDTGRMTEEQQQALMLAARKDSKLLEKLELLRKQQIVLQMYTSQIKQASVVHTYRRKTYLDQPADTDMPTLEETFDQESGMGTNDNKLSREDQIEDYDIKAQFVAGAAAEFETTQQQLKMNVEADIARLALMQLESLNKLKLSLPSDNVENRYYMKKMQQMILSDDKGPQGDKQHNPSFQGSNRGSMVQSVSSLRTGSIVQNQSIRGSTLSIAQEGDDQRTNSSRGSFGSQTQSIKNGPDESRSYSQERTGSSTSSIGWPGASKADFTDVRTQSSPLIKRVDQLDPQYGTLWQSLVTELQTNPVLMADVVSRVMSDGYEEEEFSAFDSNVSLGGYDQNHSTMLVHLGQFFWDSIHTEERLAFKESNNFLKFFLEFSKKEITKEKFAKNDLNYIYIKDQALRKTLMCMFEGLTRKIPAFNFLKFIYAGPFNKINLYMIEQDLMRIANRTAEAQQNQLNNSRNTLNSQEESKDGQKQPERKSGFFKSIWEKLSSKDEKPKEKEKSKSAPVNNVSSQLVSQFIQQKKSYDDEDDELEFDNFSADFSQTREASTAFSTRDSVQSRSTLPPGVKLFESMARVYGGPAEPFTKIDNKRDDGAHLKRFEEIEAKISENQANNQKFVMDEYPDFKSLKAHRIQMTEAAVRDLCSGNHKNAKKMEDEAMGTGKTTKDLTYYIKALVQKNFEQMLNFSNKIPFSIRAMLKTLIIRSRGLDDFNYKVKLNEDEIHMLASIMIGGWLNIGYRNPKCFGIQPPVEKELELEYIFFQAARITFEHTMMMQIIPEDEFIHGFDVIELNRFIRTMSSHVFVFWIRLINVDITEITNKVKPQLIDSAMMRIDDLELLYIYCTKVQLDVKNGISRRTEEFGKFDQIMSELDDLVTMHNYEDFDPEIELPLIPKNIYDNTLSSHFQELFQIDPSPEPHPYEYFLLFLNRKSPQQIQSDLKNWQTQCQEDIKTMNQKFVIEQLAVTVKEAEVLTDKLIGRNNSMKVKKSARYSVIPPKLQRKTSTLEEKPQEDLRMVQISQFNTKLLPMTQIEASLVNLFNSLRVIMDCPQLIFECLRDQTSLVEVNDIVALFTIAEKSVRANIKIEVGCQHIVKMFQKLGLENNFEVQNKIMSHFLRTIEHKIKQSKRYLDTILYQVETLAVDVEKYEINITNLKQFHTKYENNLKFMKTISRYNPEVCFLECFKFELNDDWKHFRGLLLNLSCSQHQTNLPMSSYMLFGVVSHKAAGVVNVPQPEGQELIGKEEFDIRKVRQKRINRFTEHYYTHTAFTVSLQSSMDGTRPRDEQIKLIEAMIQYYTQKQKSYLKTLIRADDEKYRALLQLNLVKFPEYCITEKDKFDYLRQNEPFDYMNMVKTYTMFLQHISVLSSTSPNDKYVDKSGDKDFQIKQHYDFLYCDLPAKALRYSVHDYIMKRMHRTIFGTNKNSDIDVLVQKLILQKKNDPLWVLTSVESRKAHEKGLRTEDFTGTPEWCDPFIYSASLKTLLRVSDEETPHIKAIYIDDAVTQAINAMKIATPYKKSDAFGEPERQRVMRHLILEVCKIYDRASTNPRLYSQLLYILLFNVPQNELMYYQLIKAQNQRHVQNPQNEVRDFSKLDPCEQHSLVMGQISSRNKVYEWFAFLKSLIEEDRVKQQTAK